MELDPFVLPAVNLSLLAGVVIFVLRVVAKGTWMHAGTHKEIVDQLVARYEEMREDRNYWRSENARKAEYVEQAMSTTKAAVKAANGTPPP